MSRQANLRRKTGAEAETAGRAKAMGDGEAMRAARRAEIARTERRARDMVVGEAVKEDGRFQKSQEQPGHSGKVVGLGGGKRLSKRQIVT